MEKIASLTMATDRGTATLEYTGEAGHKVWQWTFADGTMETQPNAGAMAAFKSQINAR
jgi:hypothetical protein